MENYDTPESNKPVFAKLDGTPAHILVIIGFVLALFAPLIPNFKNASVTSAFAAVEKAQEMIGLDLEDFRKAQEAEEKADTEKMKDLRKRIAEEKSKDAALLPEEYQRLSEERDGRISNLEKENTSKVEAREKVAEQKREELEKKYTVSTLKREALDEKASAAGARWHMVIGWLGSALLIIGLVILVIQSEGTRQKVILVILVLVMFSALAGLNLNLRAEGRMGDSGKPAQAAPESPPEPPMPKPTPAPTPQERIYTPPPSYP